MGPDEAIAPVDETNGRGRKLCALADGPAGPRRPVRLAEGPGPQGTVALAAPLERRRNAEPAAAAELAACPFLARSWRTRLSPS